MRRYQMRAPGGLRRVLAIPLLLVSTSACSLFGPELESTYVLARIDGQPVPAAHLHGRTTRGGTLEFRVLRGSLRFYSNGRFEKERDGQMVYDGVPEDSLRAPRWRGRFVRKDSTITIFFKDEWFDQEFTYTLRDGGTRLVGYESLGPYYESVYVYLLQ
jgi:hypothetical protein